MYQIYQKLNKKCMSKKIKIYYAEMIGCELYDMAKTISYDVCNLFEETDNESIYKSCPAWSHKAKRTFLIKSPLDMTFNLNDSSCIPGTFNISPKLESNNITQKGLQEIVELHENWYNEKKITIQLNIPRYVFWTDEKNIWMDLKSSALTPQRCNYRYVGGWFNISDWCRPASFAFDVIDKKQSIIIKRGDILNEVCFYSNNLDDIIILERSELSEKLYKNIENRLSLKNYIHNMSGKMLFNSQPVSKCPFLKVFKK